MLPGLTLKEIAEHFVNVIKVSAEYKKIRLFHVIKKFYLFQDLKM